MINGHHKVDNHRDTVSPKLQLLCSYSCTLQGQKGIKASSSSPILTFYYSEVSIYADVLAK